MCEKLELEGVEKMSSLYQISKTYQELFDEFDDKDLDEETMQAYFDTLEGIEAEFNDKAGNVAIFIKNLLAEAENLKKEKQALEKRQKAKENKADKLKKYLLENMNKLGVKKIETIQAVISTRKNAESVQIADEQKFINWAEENNIDLLTFAKPKISKSAVKDAINAGAEIPYCQLARTQSVTIK